ncbi:MAG: hypothetical protein ONB12_01175 [candidate division KSB1 bacterium]|nr:hypothetical protein [candidate division KSB1 bacterium]
MTNAAEIRSLVGADSILWAASNGGVLRISPASGKITKFTNTEGLAQIDVSSAAVASSGAVWAVLPDGLLQIYDPKTGEWDKYHEFQNRLRIFTIYPFQDIALVGADMGVAELRLDAKQRWERSWKAEIGAVKRLAVAVGYIWAAQEDGLRRIPIDFPNKQIPSAWEKLTVLQGLPAGEITALLPAEGGLYVGAQAGLAFFDGVTWRRIDVDGAEVRDLAEWQGTICFASENGVYARKNNAYCRLGGGISNLTALVAAADGTLWAGTSDAGFYIYRPQDGSWQHFIPDGPGSNLFSDLLIDRDGCLWAASSKRQTGGVYYFDGKRWHNFFQRSGLAHYDYRTLAEDPFGRIWAGSWGGGVTLFEKVARDSVVFTNLRDMNGGLSGIPGYPNYVVVTKILPDAEGRLWFLNYEAADRFVLRVFDLDRDWQMWSTLEGIRSTKVVDLAIDPHGRKWIATEDYGVSVLDDNKTPFDKSDDDLTGYLAVEDGLESNAIRAIACDLDGTMWIGTLMGLHYWFGGKVGIRYNVINDNILSLFVDPRNNKWIGTGGGLSVLDADNYNWTHYSTSTSPLTADVVTCFALNDATGEMYIGTTNGLSILETPFTRPAANLEAVYGYPNPFIIDQPGARFYIDRLAVNSSVRIFTTDGYLIRTIPQSQVLGARVAWDGKNDQGEDVADGIYIFLVTTREGAVKAGKVALIRR